MRILVLAWTKSRRKCSTDCLAKAFLFLALELTNWTLQSFQGLPTLPLLPHLLRPLPLARSRCRLPPDDCQGHGLPLSQGQPDDGPHLWRCICHTPYYRHDLRQAAYARPSCCRRRSHCWYWVYPYRYSEVAHAAICRVLPCRDCKWTQISTLPALLDPQRVANRVLKPPGYLHGLPHCPDLDHLDLRR
jgi:hypothetical protein